MIASLTLQSLAVCRTRGGEVGGVIRKCVEGIVEGERMSGGIVGRCRIG